MRHNLTIRWVIVAGSLLASLWYVWPTYRFYSLSDEARDELQVDDPNAWTALREKAIQLGLDLQGGMHLVLELDESERTYSRDERSAAIDRALEIVRNRIDQFGVVEPLIQKIGDERIIVELPGIQDETRAKELVQQAAFLEFQMVVDENTALAEIRRIDALLASREPAPADSVDATGAEGVSDEVEADSTAVADSAATTTLSDLVDEDGGTGALAGLGGDRPFSVQLVTQPLGIPGQIEFLVEETRVPAIRALLSDPEVEAVLDDRLEWLWAGTAEAYADGRGYRTLFLVEREPELTGDAIASAAATYETQVSSQPIVSLVMTSDGSRRFADITGSHVNQRMAIVLDNVVRMAPNIRQRITGGRAQIEGFKDIEEARDIGIVLQAGALPAPLNIIEERTVGPSLGADSIEAGRRAGLIGLLAVAIFMVLYYRVAGLAANLALAFNILIIMASLAGIGATLTLPGIAGLILTVGMAVDANVLVFERIREELDLGKSVRAAIDAGYDRALVTILDAQITTLIAAAVLFQFGTGPLKGFAIVLSLGILSSIFTAVFVTRTFFNTWSRTRPARNLSI